VGQRAATLENALNFWAEQVKVEESTIGNREGVLKIRFEDILTNPESSIENLLDFISAPKNPTLMQEMKESLDPSRAFSYKSDPKLLEFAENNSTILSQFGY
jgi:hypothetical protein